MAVRRENGSPSWGPFPFFRSLRPGKVRPRAPGLCHIGYVPPFPGIAGLDHVQEILVAVGIVVVIVLSLVAATLLGRRSGRRAIAQRLAALGNRLGLDPPEDEYNIETSLAYLEQVTGGAAQAVTEASSDAIRLRRSLDTLTQGVVLCDENGTVIYRNGRANALMVSRHGDALAAQAVTELLEDAWHEGAAERTLDLYGPPRRTLQVPRQPDRRRPAAAGRHRADRGHLQVPAARGDQARLRGQRQPRAQDADGRAGSAGRDPGVRARSRRRPPPGRAHPQRGLPGQPHHRRSAGPVAHRVRRGPTARAGARQPGDGRRHRARAGHGGPARPRDRPARTVASRRRDGRPPPAHLGHARAARERDHLLLRQLEGRGHRNARTGQRTRCGPSVPEHRGRRERHHVPRDGHRPGIGPGSRDLAARGGLGGAGRWAGATGLHAGAPRPGASPPPRRGRPG